VAQLRLYHLRKRRRGVKPFACLTAYDAAFASIISAQGIEALLVGDSLGMTIQGHDSTLPVTAEQMVYHTECVRRGNRGSVLISDMPFASYGNREMALRNAALLMRAGAHVVKLEGGAWLADTVQRLNHSGIPVCGHLGLRPQSVHLLGGYHRQAEDAASADALFKDAEVLQEAGISLLVLECIPPKLAARITRRLYIPTIGIGCGGRVDGQVMVLQDILGLSENPPSFARNFLQQGGDIAAAIRQYGEAVRAGEFPGD